MKSMNTKLKHISFAGIDNKTDINDLKDIQEEYPIVEWGILMSINWSENGNRYMNPAEFQKFAGLHLCGHLCGKLARDMMKGDMTLLYETYPHWDKIFKRIQINVASFNNFTNGIVWSGEQELYIQCKPNKYDNYIKSSGVGMLIDNSGGRGIDEEWVIYPTNKKIGYAGGLNPNNVVLKTKNLMNNPKVGDFWIDMESGVRTNDWFDTEKVRMVLKNLKDANLID